MLGGLSSFDLGKMEDATGGAGGTLGRTGGGISRGMGGSNTGI
jgi:hypothetical protein